MEINEKGFGVTDYIIFGLSLLISLGIGVLSAVTGRKQKTTDDFYFGSRDLNVYAVALSMAATFLSAIAILGFPAEVYYNGISIAMMLLTDTLAALIAIFIFIPFFYNLGLTSVYEMTCPLVSFVYIPNEYFELRFSRLIRRIACFIFVVNMLLYIAIVLFAPACVFFSLLWNLVYSLALSQVSKLPLWACIVSTGLVCTIYTAIGGMKAVVWTDAFQMIVMFFGVLTIVIVGVIKSDGLPQVWENNRETGRLDMSFSPNPTIRHTFWTLLIGGFFNILSAGVNQATVQRYFSVKSARAAQKMYILTGFVVTFWKCSLFFVGLLMFAYYMNCDPLLSGRIERRDQIAALYVLDVVSFIPGFAGLFTAIICSATLSTVSSGVNSIVVVINEDFIKPALRSKNRESGGGGKFFIRLSKWLSLLVGLIGIGLAFLASLASRGLVQFSLSVYGMCGGPLMGLFVCGMLLPYCNAKGAASGLLVSLGVVFWIMIAAMFTQSPSPPLPLSTDSCVGPFMGGTNSSFFNVTILPPEPISPLPTTSPAVGNCTDACQNCVENCQQCLDPCLNCFSEPESFGLKTIYSISYLYYSLLGFTITILVASIVSLLTGRHRESTIPDQFLLYKMWGSKDKSKDIPAVRRPYAYSHVEGMDLALFDQRPQGGSQTKVMRKVSGKR